MKKETTEGKVYNVPFTVTGKGSVHVLAESQDAAENFIAELGADQLMDLDCDYEVETETASEEDGEEYDFDATSGALDDEDDDDEEEDAEEDEDEA